MQAGPVFGRAGRGWRTAIAAIIGAVLVVVGLLAAWGLWSVHGIYRDLASSGHTVEAEMTGFEAAWVGSRASRREVYYPILEFTTAEGQRIRTTSYTAIDPADYIPAARVTAVYSAADPALAMPVSALSAWPDGTAWAIGAFSLLCLLVGGILLRAGLARP
jgi:hypothetical protein